MVNPRKQRSYDKGNYPDFMNELEQKDWSSILSENEVIDANWKKQLKLKDKTQWSLFPSGLVHSRSDIIGSSLVFIRSSM
jgi:hypothetical protein